MFNSVSINGVTLGQSTPTAEVRQVDDLSTLKSLIGNYARELDKARGETKLLNEQIKSVVENDSAYSVAKAAFDEAQRTLKMALANLNAKPEVASLKIKVKEQREVQKEIKETLSNHLANYVQKTGTRSIDTPAGDEVELVQVVSIKPQQLKLFAA